MLQHLGRSVWNASNAIHITESSQHLFVVHYTLVKVNDDEVELLIRILRHNHVLWFDIQMNDVVGMELLQSIEQGHKEGAALLFAWMLLIDILKQINSFIVLENHDDVVFILVLIDVLHQILGIDAFEDFVDLLRPF